MRRALIVVDVQNDFLAAIIEDRTRTDSPLALASIVTRDVAKGRTPLVLGRTRGASS